MVIGLVRSEEDESYASSSNILDKSYQRTQMKSVSPIDTLMSL